MSDLFLSIAPGERALARSPMSELARRAGARFESRAGWEVAVDFRRTDTGAGNPAEVGFADTSAAPKLELQADASEIATIAAGAGASIDDSYAGELGGEWWCPLGPSRLLVLGEPGHEPGPVRAAVERAALDMHSGRIADLTTSLASLTVVGPAAAETLAQFTAPDTRPATSPPGAFLPGSLARTPGAILCEGQGRFRLLFGWAFGEYMWTVVADAATRLGGGPIGIDALERRSAAPGPALEHA